MMTRALRQFTAKLVVAMLLFMQLAVAAYACPNLLGPTDPAALKMANDDGMSMPGCAEGDKTEPHLCQQHCQQGSQSADNTVPGAIPVAVLPLLAVLVPAPAPVGPAANEPREVLARTTAPPLAIRFCVFRT